MRQGLIARHRAVSPAKREGKPGTRGGERLEALRSKDAGGADIKGIGDDKCALPPMERSKNLAFV